MNAIAPALLIVDDDPVFAQFVRQLVLVLGEEFPCAPQCVDAADKAMIELSQSRYELVLLDYHLPGADGLQVLEQIRGLPEEQQPAVIMLTGSGNEAVAVEAMKRGARDYLPKAGLDVVPLLRVLRNALAQKLLSDQLARHNAQARADLEMARQLQQSLLPDSYPSFPNSAAPADSDLRFCHRFCPASELAGDFFSVFALSDFQAGVLICDVMGHGVRSALVTAMLRTLVDSAARRGVDPVRFLSHINQRLTTLLKPVEGPLFATAFYLVADTATGRLRYASAGHPPPLHLRPARDSVVPLPLPPHPGPALGLFPDATYLAGEYAMETGDLVLLFTDGLFETTTPDGREEYGQHRLIAAARRNLQRSPLDLCDALIDDVRFFAGDSSFADDVCLLSLEAVRVRSRRAKTRNPANQPIP